MMLFCGHVFDLRGTVLGLLKPCERTETETKMKKACTAIYRTERGYLVMQGEVVEKFLSENEYNITQIHGGVIEEYKIPEYVSFTDYDFDTAIGRQKKGLCSYQPTDENIVFMIASTDKKAILEIYKSLINNCQYKIKSVIESQLDKIKNDIKALNNDISELEKANSELNTMICNLNKGA